MFWSQEKKINLKCCHLEECEGQAAESSAGENAAEFSVSLSVFLTSSHRAGVTSMKDKGKSRSLSFSAFILLSQRTADVTLPPLGAVAELRQGK